MLARKEEEKRAVTLDIGIEDLRHYLRAWSRWVRSWRAPLGLPSCVSMVGQMLPSVSGWSHDEDIDESIDGHIMREIDREIERLPALQRAAVRLYYLNETMPAVFRSNRMTRAEMTQMCRAAEELLVPRLRQRGVHLRV